MVSSEITSAPKVVNSILETPEGLKFGIAYFFM